MSRLTCSWRHRISAGVLRIVVSGALRRTDVEELRACIVELLLRSERARAVVLDLRGAVPLLSTIDWEDIKRCGSRTAIPVDVPMAILVPECLLKACDQYARQMAHIGRARFFFNEPCDAATWLESRLRRMARARGAA